MYEPPLFDVGIEINDLKTMLRERDEKIAQLKMGLLIAEENMRVYKRLYEEARDEWPEMGDDI